VTKPSGKAEGIIKLSPRLIKIYSISMTNTHIHLYFLTAFTADLYI